MNYSNALAAIQNKKNGDKTTKKMANHTYLTLHCDQSVSLRLHSTDIITWYADGTIETHTGGWETVTTKDRINSNLDGYNIYTDRGIWYIRDLRNDFEYIYESGRLQDSTGKCILTPSISEKLHKYAGRPVSSLEEAIQTLKVMTLDQLQKLWKHCGPRWRKASARAFIVTYCIKEFLPLVLNDSDESDGWKNILMDRLSGGTHALPLRNLAA